MHTHFFNLHKKPLTYCYFVIELKTIEAVSKSTLFDALFNRLLLAFFNSHVLIQQLRIKYAKQDHFNSLRLYHQKEFRPFVGHQDRQAAITVWFCQNQIVQVLHIFFLFQIQHLPMLKHFCSIFLIKIRYIFDFKYRHW